MNENSGRYISRMFAKITQRYDLMNTLMSWGQDKSWRRLAAALACPTTNGWTLDLATGTAELAIQMAKSAERVIGLDLCLEIVDYGRTKAIKKGLVDKIGFVMGDALALPFADNCFACTATAFAMRSVADIGRSFVEMRRVIKPGGKVICLELTKPRSRLVANLYQPYLSHFVPCLGRWVSGDGQAYTYLFHSLTSFPNAEELKGIMEEAGLRNVTYQTLNLGTVAIHVGMK